ncbi:MAG TPA: hypothetical protein VK530_19260 [Candidatus Acidoferrum sp.]|nr:hypothetical protein [Candidatus Acidoferrum sp.]
MDHAAAGEIDVAFIVDSHAVGAEIGEEAFRERVVRLDFVGVASSRADVGSISRSSRRKRWIDRGFILSVGTASVENETAGRVGIAHHFKNQCLALRNHLAVDLGSAKVFSIC